MIKAVKSAVCELLPSHRGEGAEHSEADEGGNFGKMLKRPYCNDFP